MDETAWRRIFADTIVEQTGVTIAQANACADAAEYDAG